MSDEPEASHHPIAARRWRQWGWGPAKNRWFLLALPVVAFLLALFAYPTLEILQRSLTVFTPPEAGGLDNYRWIVENDVNVTVMVRTLETAAFVTGACLLLGYPFAYLLTIVSGRTRALLLGVVIVTGLMSVLVRSYAWVIILQANGPLNDLLRAVGAGPVELKGHISGVVIAMTQILLPLMILPVYANMRNIDLRLIRASSSLGARPLTTFFRVYLPMSVPGVMAGVLLVFVVTLGFYITPSLVGSPANALSSQLIATQVTSVLAWGRAGALSVVLLMLTLLVLLAVARLVRQRPGQRPKGGGMTALESDAPVGGRASRRLLIGLGGLITLLLVGPLLVIAPISLTGQASFAFPPTSWSTQWYGEFFSNPEWTGALQTSLTVGVVSTLLATVLGTASAFAIARGRFRGKSALLALIMAPMITPIVIIGVGIYAVFLDWKFVGTDLGFILAHTVLAIPFVVIAVSASLRTFDERVEAAAASLGATPLRTFWSVTLPLILPGIASGALFAFVTSFDEIVVSLFVATADKLTVPVQMYNALTREIDPTVAAAATLIAVLTTVVLVGAGLLGRRLRYGL